MIAVHSLPPPPTLVSHTGTATIATSLPPLQAVEALVDGLCDSTELLQADRATMVQALMQAHDQLLANREALGSPMEDGVPAPILTSVDPATEFDRDLLGFVPTPQQQAALDNILASPKGVHFLR